MCMCMCMCACVSVCMGECVYRRSVCVCMCVCVCVHTVHLGCCLRFLNTLSPKYSCLMISTMFSMVLCVCVGGSVGDDDDVYLDKL